LKGKKIIVQQWYFLKDRRSFNNTMKEIHEGKSESTSSSSQRFYSIQISLTMFMMRLLMDGIPVILENCIVLMAR
jgi:hypothetical protein